MLIANSTGLARDLLIANATGFVANAAGFVAIATGFVANTTVDFKFYQKCCKIFKNIMLQIQFNPRGFEFRPHGQHAKFKFETPTVHAVFQMLTVGCCGQKKAIDSNPNHHTFNLVIAKRVRNVESRPGPHGPGL